jgi:hypothetical protein
MPRWYEEDQPVPTREAFDKLTIDYLKPMAGLLRDRVPTRKGELVEVVAGAMQRPATVRTLYEELDPLAQRAVQEAAHDTRGMLHEARFVARYGRMPDFHNPSPEEEASSYYRDYRSYRRPTKLALFFPRYRWLPTDLRELLLAFVPAPPEFTLPTLAEVPASVAQTHRVWRKNTYVEEREDVLLRVRATAAEALHDVRAVLRLIQLGQVRVTGKMKQPTAASQRAVAGVLLGGDFYSREDQDSEDYGGPADLAMKAFAWPMIAQAAGLAEMAGGALRLTPAGLKALAQPPRDAIRAAWKKWRTSKILDEFSRVEAVKGQGKAGLSALAERRKAVLDGLAACPPNVWFAVDDFFRFLRATDRDFTLSHRRDSLYIGDRYYGNLAHVGGDEWKMLQGRYVLAVFFEYAATLGLLDVAYLPPERARTDDCEGGSISDHSCLSRYDGLQYVRVNPLGAWCLGLAESYEPQALPVAEVLQVLPNLDVVVKQPPLEAADRMLLGRFAEQQSEAVWHLAAVKVLPVLEEGGSLDELDEFLNARSAAPLPQTVRVFLDDLRRRASQLRDRGLVRLVECADATLADMLAADPQLRGKCQRDRRRGRTRNPCRRLRRREVLPKRPRLPFQGRSPATFRPSAQLASRWLAKALRTPARPLTRPSESGTSWSW